MTTDLNALADRLGMDRDTVAAILWLVKATHPPPNLQLEDGRCVPMRLVT